LGAPEIVVDFLSTAADGVAAAVARWRLRRGHKRLYNPDMNEASFTELSAWLIQAGLAGTSETDIVSGFCNRCVAAGLPLGRTQVFIDTLHPVHEGRLFRWGQPQHEALNVPRPISF
jgi:hypothetical protein